jgi:hypothetical protein
MRRSSVEKMAHIEIGTATGTANTAQRRPTPN